MIKPELKYIEFANLADETSWDCAIIPAGLAAYAFIGPIGQNSSESFFFRVFTVDDLAEVIKAEARDYIFCRNMLVVSCRDLDNVRSAINDLCSMISGESWADVSKELSLYAESEYENYRQM